MTLAFILSDAARADLRGIWAHSAEQWGRPQARTYLMGLDGVFSMLTEYPEIGLVRREVRPPVRLHPYRSHRVIYRTNDLVLDVLRVVHFRSNWIDLFEK